MSTSISTLLTLCQAHSAKLEHDAALDALGSALRLADQDKKADRVQILDHRVAVYLSLKNREFALKDAKSMIRHNRTDARGYLRCGQIERLNGNIDEAKAWYEQGMKRVPVAAPRYASMRKQIARMEAEACARIVQSKSIDPMITLPLEVVEIIISHLSYKQIVVLLRVSKPWNKLLRRMRPLIDTVDYRGAKKPITTFSLRATLRMLKSPKQIMECNLSDRAAILLHDRLQYWQNFAFLETLHLRPTPSLELPYKNYISLKYIHLSPREDIYSTLVWRILGECHNLETAIFHEVTANPHKDSSLWNFKCHKLRVLTIEAVKGTDGIGISTVALSKLHNLQELTLSGCCFEGDLSHPNYRNHLHSLTSLRVFRMDHCFASNDIILPDSLQVLELSEMESPGLNRGQADGTATSLKNLWSLSFSGPFWPSCLRKDHLLANCSNLIDLELSLVPFTDDSFMDFLQAGCFENVQRLKLTLQSIEDVHSALFIKGFAGLRVLHLQGALITGVFIMDLLDADSCKINQILLKGCDKVSSDIVDWATNRGVDIKLIKSQEIGSSRVRER